MRLAAKEWMMAAQDDMLTIEEIINNKHLSGEYFGF